MNLRKALEAPKQLVTATQNATTLAVIALIVAGIALIVASHRVSRGGN
jgi:type IV secretory pathway VirB2 component (pilin)